MTKIFYIGTTDQLSKIVEPGSILKFIDEQYQYKSETPGWGNAFQIIGAPIEEDNIQVTYTFATTEEPFKTHIKCV